jgi:hypothetical protein
MGHAPAGITHASRRLSNGLPSACRQALTVQKNAKNRQECPPLGESIPA